MVSVPIEMAVLQVTTVKSIPYLLGCNRFIPIWGADKRPTNNPNGAGSPTKKLNFSISSL